jgi:hypothetical protein
MGSKLVGGASTSSARPAPQPQVQQSYRKRVAAAAAAGAFTRCLRLAVVCDGCRWKPGWLLYRFERA